MYCVAVILMVLINISAFIHARGIIYPGKSFSEKNPTFPSCFLHSGEIGECKNIFACPPVLVTFRSEKPVHCQFKKKVPIVCCPKTNTNSLIRETNTKILVAEEVINIPKIFKNLQCGISEKYFEEHVIRNHNTSRQHHHHQHHPHSRKRRYVVGGQESATGEFPWMALLGKMESKDPGEITWICDAVLIHPEWVLTAAHCLLEFFTYVIRLGEHNISSNSETVHDFVITTIVFHPDFKLDVNYHDLAMVKLPSPAIMTSSLMPVCLPWENNPNLTGKKATLAGWGAEFFGGSLSNVLRDVDVKIFESSVCDENYSTLRDYRKLWPSGITSKYLICAGGKSGGVDSCHGDSGGPLMLNKGNKLELVGIVSKGFGCGKKDFPGIYIAVRSYLIWICDVILK